MKENFKLTGDNIGNFPGSHEETTLDKYGSKPIEDPRFAELKIKYGKMLNLIKKQQQPGMSSLNAKQEAELKELKTFIDKETLTMTPKQHLELQKMEHQQHKLSEKESK